MALPNRPGSLLNQVFAFSDIRRLTFADAELEQRFRANGAADSRLALRRAVILGVLAFSAFGVPDILLFEPEITRRLLYLRLLVSNLIFVASFWATYTPAFTRWNRAIIGATIVAVGMTIWTMVLIATPAANTYYVGLLITIFFSAFVLGDCWACFAMSSTFLLVAYSFGALFVFQMPPDFQLISIMFTVTAVGVGITASYVREETLRRSFALGDTLRSQHDKVSATNIDLERRVADRMAEAVALNEELQAELATRQQAERDLASERDVLSLVLEAMNDIVVVFDPANGKPVRWNPSILRITGFSARELVGRRVPDDWMSPQDAERARTAMETLGRSGKSAATVLLTHKDGHKIPVEFVGSLLTMGNDQPPLMIALGRDLSERQRAQRALRTSRERLELALRSTSMGIWEYDWRTQRLHMDRRSIELLGVGSGQLLEVIRELGDHVQHSHRDQLARLFRSHLGQERDRFDTEYGYELNGRHLWIAMSGGVAERSPDGTPLRTIGLLRDVTNRHALDERIRETAKLEAIGRLAGGVAHDFNNLLTVINGYGEMAMMSLDGDSELHEMLQLILEQGQRAASLTRQLLTFSRREPLDLRPLDVNVHVGELAKMLRRLIGEDVDLVLELGANLPPILADPTQLGQVIMNLAVNARDAMPEGGSLTITSQALYLAEPLPMRVGDLDTGRYVVLQVTDTGLGMDEETLTHLFEPFYTTKPQGQGTGLGLAVVYGVMDQLDGGIDVTSAPGEGTTFRLYLAVSDNADADVVDDVTPISHGHETILLVEDEAAVRSLVRRMLEGWGYDVKVAHEAIEARAMAALMDRPPDLLLTDVVMPMMTGPALAEELLTRWPDLKVLYMTGYANSLVQEPLPPNARLLTKPLKQSELSATLRELLGDG